MARLLLVDDDLGTLEWMSAALEASGHEVRTVQSGHLALEALGTWSPQLIITDLLMPEMDGLAFAHVVRRFRGTPLMFISVARREAEAVLSGALGYVRKPASAAEVRRAVEQVLGRGAARNTILVVDDDDIILDLYRTILEPRFQVLTAGDGRAALSMLEARAVDLMIADVHMPIMNGVDLIRAVRRDPRLRGLPVLVQTSDNSLIQAPVWVDLQVSQVLAKSEFMRWICAQIDNHTGGRS
jgi:CheY-like chemotaxis protein